MAALKGADVDEAIWSRLITCGHPMIFKQQALGSKGRRSFALGKALFETAMHSEYQHAAPASESLTSAGDSLAGAACW